MKRPLQRNASGEATIERIFDAAEAAFVRQGYEGMSLRSVAGEAGVNVGVMPYYWGNKQALLGALCAQRLGPLIAARRAGLEALEDSDEPGAADIRAVIEAYVAPLFAPEMRKAGPLWARLSGETAPEAMLVAETLIVPLDQAFDRRLRRVCSHLDFEPFAVRLKLLHAGLGADMPDTASEHDITDALSALMRTPFRK